MTTTTAPRAAPWTRRDSVAIAVITFVAGALRVISLRTPPTFVFDEFYAADACLFVRGADAACGTLAEVGIVHPPLAKWLIGAGIEVFGFSSGGWRVAPVVAGTLGVAVVYLLARRITGSTLGAALASSLLAVDLLHFVMSRTAMLDVFVVLFGAAAFLFLLYDTDRAPVPADASAWRRLAGRRWLVASGLAGGAATACKWSGGYLLAGVVVVAVVHAARRGARRDAVAIVVCLVVIPALVYTATFAGRVHGALLAWPWTDGSWWDAFVARQRLMADGHLGALPDHPYMSPAWSWPLVKRPVLFSFDGRAGTYREILAVGNPLLWTAGLVAVGAVAWRARRERAVGTPDLVVVAGFAAAYLPWFVLTRDESFLYYFLPAVPFLYLALARVAVTIDAARARRVVTGALGVVAAAGFVFYFPLLTHRPLSYDQWHRRVSVFDCRGGGTEQRHRPVTDPVPPPSGWCWV